MNFPSVQVIKHAVDNEKLVNDYETLTSDLKDWIVEKIGKLQDRTFGNSLITVQQQMMEFNLFRTQDKPPKYVGNSQVKTYLLKVLWQILSISLRFNLNMSLLTLYSWIINIEHKRSERPVKPFSLSSF